MTYFLKSIKENETVIKLMKSKKLKATKAEVKKGKDTVVEYFIGEHKVSKQLIGARGAVKVEVNTDLVSLITYLNKV